jgi:Protein of unknown function (DUF3551)
MPGFKLTLSAALAIAAMSATATPAAAAIEYPWCVEYGGGDAGSGGRNCGFVSWEQCMETARGAGGNCERNLFYPGNDTPQPQRSRKRATNNN